MIGRRRFLEAVSLGLASASLGSSNLFAQDPPSKSKSKAKGKGKKATSKSRPADETRPPVDADEQISRIVGQARTDGRRLPGMIGAVVKGEELSGLGAVGIRKIGSPEPMRADDLVHLGSCTKAMTATMIGTLVDEGKLRWDSTVLEVFPEWEGKVHPGYASVGLAQLLAHRGGLPHDVAWWEGGYSLPVVEQRRALLLRALQASPKDKPGSTYAYSNVGFVLAGAMAEQVTQTPWEDLMRRRLFGPLGMTSAGFGPPGKRGLVDHAWGHRASGDLVEAVHEDNAPSMGPAGTVHCSMRDWARFASLHLRGSLGGTRLLKAETLKALHTPKLGENYVGGWSVFDRSWAGGKALMHNGSNTLWFCTIWLAPARDLALLVATNAAGKPAEEACDQAIQGLLRYAIRDDQGRRR
jgi:CubicO group peptidase (beta-lactamase class C family)